MNKNLFIYSFKYLAVLIALVTFSSCERDEFTEQDAFDLQQAQLNAQDAREQAALAAQDQRVMDMAMFRRSMDSLTRLNSGGKVFYTVNVVPGGSSAFSSGRFEEVEGLDGATVTVSQLGGSVVEQKTTVGGLASFEMYSGEVTVNIEAANHTDLNYTANLTPDGGVPNGALMYVGNVVPVFDDPNNPAAGSEENLATVKGFAFAELDITGGNNFEESVPDGTKVRAFIDVANPAFKTKYIDQANEEGVNTGGQPTKSGFIQRFAYEEAASTTGSTVTSALNNDTAPDGGEYSITIGATASGLPITMKFDDFAADRAYFFGGRDLDQGSPSNGLASGGVKRFIYTQNTQNTANTFDATDAVGANQLPTAITFRGNLDIFSDDLRLDFSLVTTNATATAALTGGDVVASVAVSDGGYYYEAPTVTIAAPTTGTTATATATLGAITGTTANDVAAIARGLRKVTGVTIATGAGGSGYTSNPAVTFTRKSFTGRDAAGAPVANGVGSVAAPSSEVKYIRIVNGGFGMNPAVTAGAPITGVGTYTGIAPNVIFNNNLSPTGNAADLAAATAIVDEVVGTVTEVQVTAGGDGYNDATLDVAFGYGADASVTAINTTPALFEVAAGGELRWNTLVPTRTATVTSGEVQIVGGTNYTFVPSVTLTGLNAPAGATLPTFAATVTNGVVTAIEMIGATTGWGAVGAEFNGTINIIGNPDGSNVSAEGFTQGGSIDTYTFTNYGSSNDVYKTTIEAATTTFNYLTTINTGAGTIVDENGATVLPAGYAAASDYIVVFENPTAAGGDNAWGYPIFDNSGNNVVGLFLVNQGIGYTNPAPANYNFWLVPADLAANAKSSFAQYAGTNGTADANANATSTRTAQVLTMTFVTPGSGYAIRPEFIISGGQRSAEDLAVLNTGINGVRGQLNFNSAGEIINTSVSTAIAANTFTAAGLAAEPISVTVSMDRLDGIFDREVNWQTNFADWDGGIEVTTDTDTQINAPAGWIYNLDNQANSTPLAMFNEMEGDARNFTAADRIGTNSAANADFKYITAPTYTISFFGFDTGGNGTAVLDPNTADITALSATNNGTFPTGLTISSFSVATNDDSYPATGERFRTVGGPSNFEVFSGLTYIRDVNYGTGIELE